LQRKKGERRKYINIYVFGSIFERKKMKVKFLLIPFFICPKLMGFGESIFSGGKLSG
jgi:hypothetical protein